MGIRWDTESRSRQAFQRLLVLELYCVVVYACYWSLRSRPPLGAWAPHEGAPEIQVPTKFSRKSKTVLQLLYANKLGAFMNELALNYNLQGGILVLWEYG